MANRVGRPTIYKIERYETYMKIPLKIYKAFCEIAEKEGCSLLDLYNLSLQEFLEHRTMFPSNYTNENIQFKLKQIYSREEL